MKLQILLLLSVIFAISDAQEICKTVTKRVDRNLRSFFFIDDDEIKIPDNKKEIVEHCRKATRAVSGLRKYKDSCTRGLSNQILALATTGITNAFLSLCASDKHDQTLKINRCLSDKIIKSFHECFYKGERMLSLVPRVANGTNILPMTCCAFNLFDQCVFASIDDSCQSSDVKVSDFFKDFFETAFDDVRDLACGRLRTVDKCESTYPKQTRRLKRVYNSNNTESTNRGSFIFSLVEISSKLGE